MKKFLVFVYSALILLIFVGCSSESTKTSSEEDYITLKFFHRWQSDPHHQYFKGVVAQFEKENPHIKIAMEAVANEAYKDKVRVLLGTSSNIPDVFFSWSGEFIHNFVRANKVLDLSPYLAEDTNWAASFVETQLEPFSLEDKQYAAPWQMGGKAFFYNKNLFRELNLEPPSTWEEFLTVLDKISTTEYTPIAFGSRAPWAVSHYIGALNQKLVDHDTRMSDYDRETGDFTDPGYIKALEKLTKLSKYFNDNPNSLDHQFAREMFSSGQAAIVYLELSELRFVEPVAEFELGFFDFPELDEEKGRPGYISGGPEGFVVSSTTKHPEEAIEFLKFLTSREMGEKLLADVGFYSAIKGAVNEDNSTPLQLEAVDILLNAEGMALWLDTDMDIAVVDAYLSGTELLLTGNKTPQDVMVEVQRAAKSIR
ncbi:ABC transporter substrate-binding protein [Alkalihalobacillus sp. BA299]|uniref:ABC transporter substrate-binding protein n=1 Tax=Alkalihalobacillus sp. BA299 TaxID=2815938 RepID=UPI001ADB920A|nr:extracellular solute-binding protein [Alkalihalobacillus sp. BA299]